MRNVRVWFTKLGRVKYISHLDINRCMTRAVRRAGLPLWYTEGYNPHPYMTFSLPLPLGVESLCESMDIRIEDEAFTNDMVKEKLNAVMPDGLEIRRVNDSVLKAKEIAFADYFITLTVEEPAGAVVEKLNAAVESCQLLAEKKVKSGHKKVVRTVNLYELIRDYRFEAEGEAQVQMEMILAAGPVKNANPLLMTETILKCAGVAPAGGSVLRRRLLTQTMEEFY